MANAYVQPSSFDKKEEGVNPSGVRTNVVHNSCQQMGEQGVRL
jgi:hypothetical protein